MKEVLYPVLPNVYSYLSTLDGLNFLLLDKKWYNERFKYLKLNALNRFFMIIVHHISQIYYMDMCLMRVNIEP